MRGAGSWTTRRPRLVNRQDQAAAAGVGGVRGGCCSPLNLDSPSRVPEKLGLKPYNSRIDFGCLFWNQILEGGSISGDPEEC